MPDCTPVKPLADLATLRTERTVRVKDASKPYVGLEHIASGRPNLRGTATADSSVSINSVFYRDDVLFGKLRPNLRKSLPAPFDGYCSTDILVLQPNAGFNAGFVGHVFRRDEVFNEAVRTAEGTKMPRTSWARLKDLLVFVPNADTERAAIARTLDEADAAIAKTEAVIAKVKSIRSGLLHDLLTRGLDHNGQLRDPIAHPEQFKDSPLGRIPRDWDSEPLARVLARIFDYRGRTPLKIGMEWGGGDIPALSANNVEMGRINFEKETHFGSRALYCRWMTNGDPHQGDVLITMEAPLGNIAQIPDSRQYILSQRVVLVRPKPELLNSGFLAIQMMGHRFQQALVRNSTGTTAVGIQRAKLETIPVCVPQSLDEQKLIACGVDSYDKRIATESRDLAKWQMLKSGLMSDLLTGRVRVDEKCLGVQGE